MTAEEALRQAEAEGLTLVKADSSTGYRGVQINNGSKGGSKPYQAKVRRGSKQVFLSNFVTDEEAALRYARTPERRAAVAAAAAQLPPMRRRRRRCGRRRRRGSRC